MAVREFLQLAHTWNPSKHGIGGWYVSEKYDGMRAYWDGGLTRGIPVNQVPFANIAKSTPEAALRPATGLWSRYGKIIYAPDFFLDALPPVPLDGELYLEKGAFQELISIVKRHQPDDRWLSVRYMAFDIPSDRMVFSDGKLTNSNFKTTFGNLSDKLRRATPDAAEPTRFRHALARLKKVCSGSSVATVAPQVQLPFSTEEAIDMTMEIMDTVINDGGEGLILRHPDSIWEPKRSHNLLKVKRFLDSEATVYGCNPGKGKLEGLMGSLIVSWQGHTFELSGFTDAERVLTSDGESAFFPVGSKVTFKYRELSDAGVPKEARYLRVAL